MNSTQRQKCLRVLVVRLYEEETGCDCFLLCLCMRFIRFTGLICEERLGCISELAEKIKHASWVELQGKL